ncbi:uncharacterized protein RCO7_14242 [Rhynchosporium graminicola]|uniref:Uncharacterized protein n=1 Tax=Rhynchosporium graminicola TaxID=2792576 RepID=A0A1E1K2D8_9HELO|nr:uncharacterized protein RCO7_14242 [Rhynchosporium commune]
MCFEPMTVSMLIILETSSLRPAVPFPKMRKVSPDGGLMI